MNSTCVAPERYNCIGDVCICLCICSHRARAVFGSYVQICIYIYNYVFMLIDWKTNYTFLIGFQVIAWRIPMFLDHTYSNAQAEDSSQAKELYLESEPLGRRSCSNFSGALLSLLVPLEALQDVLVHPRCHGQGSPKAFKRRRLLFQHPSMYLYEGPHGLC